MQKTYNLNINIPQYLEKNDIVPSEKLLIDKLNKNSSISFTRSGMMKYKKNIIPSDMVQCNNCGNIWDGFAQCNCYEFI